MKTTKGVVLAILLVLSIVAAGGILGQLSADSVDVAEYEKLVGLSPSDVKQRFGQPIEIFDSPADPNFPIGGYTTPKTPEFKFAYVYQMRFGVVYVFISQEDKVIAVEYSGG